MLRNNAAYTLVEMLIGLTILAILFNLALPALSASVERNQSRAVIEQIRSAVSLARHTAVNEGVMTTLCRSEDSKHCGGLWQQGFIVFTDQNGDHQINGNDRLVKVFPALAGKGSLKFRAFQNKQYLQMTSEGFTNYQNGNFTWCPDSMNARFAAQLIINRSGRTYLARDKDGDGIREGSNGKALSCP